MYITLTIPDNSDGFQTPKIDRKLSKSNTSRKEIKRNRNGGLITGVYWLRRCLIDCPYDCAAGKDKKFNFHYTECHY